jgi:5-(carboxyamino)imidazole ribonucleotide mutase
MLGAHSLYTDFSYVFNEINMASNSQARSKKIAICMGSQSDWYTMQNAANMLDDLEAAYEVKIISAHRTPARLTAFTKTAHDLGFAVIIAGAGGAAHLPGMLAANTHLPVLGVPIESAALKGMDSLLSIVQMPAGVPVGTLAIGQAGAKNAALLALQILALSDPQLASKIEEWRATQTASVAETPE